MQQKTKREMMEIIWKIFLRKKYVKIVLILSATMLFMLIFGWDKTSGETLQGFRREHAIEEKVIETERRAPYNIFEKMIEKENKDVLDIKDVFISVKTTLSFHKTRLKLLLDTWISTSKNQVSICM
jgi:hypothetical protein